MGILGIHSLISCIAVMMMELNICIPVNTHTQNAVGISWWCSFDRSAQDWVNIENLWAVDYKITIVNNLAKNYKPQEF